jgi:ABC-2 type transport system ATP-binding protein
LDSPDALKASLGGDVLELDIADPNPEFIEQLKNLEDVDHISSQNGKVALTVKNGESFIPRIFETAQTVGVEITSVSMRKPNLEDVFLKLTGREIRDEGVVEPKERMRIYMWARRR